MRILSLLVLCLFFVFFTQQPNSPHGKDFKVSCRMCHSSMGWQLDKSTYSFNHDKTKFALTGQHNDVNCRQCHASLIFSGAKRECNECHLDVHQATTGLDCGRCHTAASWLVNNITEIHQRSRFHLVGAHRTADCTDCHISESLVRFDVPGVECIDCHREDYMATTNPNHIQSGISEDCSICHQINAFQWSGGGFNHNLFRLAQGHSAVKCTECHTSGTFTALDPDCYSCHQRDFVATTSPNHTSSNFPTTCSNCHTLAAGWKPAAFDHSTFPLTLGHSSASCNDCHTSGNYDVLPTDCSSCHQKDFIAATNPNHVAAGFATVCTQCHSTSPGWKPVTFNHSGFPLTLGHSGRTCADCHIGGNYTSTPTDCYACHQANFVATSNPNHTESGFSTVCTQCHTTSPGWTPTTFNHSGFTLTLGHSGRACVDCHIGGNYTSTPTDCYSCHQTDYNNSSNPNHKTLAFSTVCTQCHTTNPGWQPATYAQHDTQFPIYSGKHRGQWSVCSDCHTTPDNYAQFNCIKCHSSVHSGKNYTSQECFTCHPRGTAD
jgi:predicted CXXCH cytochrome family protein